MNATINGRRCAFRMSRTRGTIARRHMLTFTVPLDLEDVKIVLLSNRPARRVQKLFQIWVNGEPLLWCSTYLHLLDAGNEVVFQRMRAGTIINIATSGAARGAVFGTDARGRV